MVSFCDSRRTIDEGLERSYASTLWCTYFMSTRLTVRFRKSGDSLVPLVPKTCISARLGGNFGFDLNEDEFSLPEGWLLLLDWCDSSITCLETGDSCCCPLSLKLRCTLFDLVLN